MLTIEEPNPSGLCMCGCGGLTPIAPVNSTKKGYVKGAPIRYIKGHNAPRGRLPKMPAPNPSGLCMCGCGTPTNRAKCNSRSGNVTGEYRRFAKHHGRRSAATMYRVDETTDCWIWLWCVNSRTGRPQLGDAGITRGAHRVLYERARGITLDSETDLHHICENRLCVNPAHMQAMNYRVHRALHYPNSFSAEQCAAELAA